MTSGPEARLAEIVEVKTRGPTFSASSSRAGSYEDLGKTIGTKDPTYIAAALHGQHKLSADEAKKLAAAVGVSVDAAVITTQMPRERCNELFGDGILSAIDCVVSSKIRVSAAY